MSPTRPAASRSNNLGIELACPRDYARQRQTCAVVGCQASPIVRLHRLAQRGEEREAQRDEQRDIECSAPLPIAERRLLERAASQAKADRRHERMTVAELAAMPHYHPTLAEIWTYPADDLAEEIAN